MMSRRAFFIASALSLGSGAISAACREEPDGERLTSIPSTHLYPAPGYLVDAQWVHQRIGDPSLALVDCSPERDYRRGHIPGARHVWWQDTIEVHNPTYGMLTGREGRERLVRAANISENSDVVCYDNRGGVYAARVIWMLHAMHFERVHLLDGGTQAWRAAGMELSRSIPGAGGGTLADRPNEEVNAHGHDIVNWIRDGRITVLDTRTDRERRETWYGRLRRGTIPGSVWIPRDQFLSPPDRHVLVPPAELIALLDQAGASVESPHLVVFGLHSTLAALPYLALRALGVGHVRVYNGSWAEWGARPEWPVEAI